MHCNLILLPALEANNAGSRSVSFLIFKLRFVSHCSSRVLKSFGQWPVRRELPIDFALPPRSQVALGNALAEAVLLPIFGSVMNWREIKFREEQETFPSATWERGIAKQNYPSSTSHAGNGSGSAAHASSGRAYSSSVRRHASSWRRIVVESGCASPMRTNS